MTVITPIYAAIIALLFVMLSVRTLLLRRRLRVGIGTGKDVKLARAIRAHANFSEYVPLALMLIYFVELHTDANQWVHALCVFLIVGRVLHAYGVSQVEENYRFRIMGMIFTFGCLLSASTGLLMSAIL
ncbi:MAG: MAPEG family protein [Cellvibrionaceae bacterium]|nr:MAPEG family protein [Cellvibrionaceae bacterium]